MYSRLARPLSVQTNQKYSPTNRGFERASYGWQFILIWAYLIANKERRPDNCGTAAGANELLPRERRSNLYPHNLSP
jgi:hypothetical protein